MEELSLHFHLGESEKIEYDLAYIAIKKKVNKYLS